MPVQEIRVEDAGYTGRLDLFLARALARNFSRSQIQRLIRSGAVTVDGRRVSAHYRLKRGETIQVESGERPPDETRAEEIPIEILAEDEDILIVNKPAGMVVHPACGNPHHTLVNALLFHLSKDAGTTRRVAPALSSVGGPARPGIVHRLDKDTSGVMVVAKNDLAHAHLARQFKNQTLERIYRVVVRGVVQHDEGLCEEPVGRAFLNRKKIMVKPSGGKDAQTYYRVLKRYRKATLLEVRLRTGRTHQIRVHMAHLGYPVLGDVIYGVSHPFILRQAVHALALGLVHPRTREKLFFEAPLPEDMTKLLAHLESE